jgi:iron complex outermembrane recepter protein
MGKYQGLLFLGMFLGSWATPVLAESDRTEESRSPLAPLKKGGTGLKVPLDKGRTALKVPLEKGGLGGSLAQNPQLTKVTGVEVKQTPSGLQIILKTPPGQAKLVPLILPEGNNLLVEILDATLAFSIRNGVNQTNPAPGISQVKVAKIDATSVRVTITGATQQPPTAEIVSGGQNLVLNVTPKATAQTKPDEEIEIVVTGQREEDNYTAPNSNVGTRTDAAIKDVPQSIQVVPKKVLEDRDTGDVNEALGNVSGVTNGGTGQFFIRGFIGQRNVLTNGVNTASPNDIVNFNLDNVEQIEVLKGPAGVLYGSGEPGGTVNLTTEKPLKESRYEIGGTIGNFNFYRPTLDFTGSLNEQKTISYRLNTSYENSGSFVDFFNKEAFSIFPILSFELGKNTTLTLDGKYERFTTEGNESSDISPEGVPISGTILSNPLGEIPLSFNPGEPDFNQAELEEWSIGYLLEHRFSDNWSLKNRFTANLNDYDYRGVGPNGEVEEDNRTLPRSAGEFSLIDNRYTLQTDVLGKFQTGIVQHDLLLGVEFTRNTGEDNRAFLEAEPIDIFEPEYGNAPNPDDFEISDSSSFEGNTIGLYAQDLLSIGKQVKFLVGGRFDRTTDSFEDLLLGETFESETVTAFSPRLGIVYQPIEPISLYAGYSTFFVPEFNTDAEGNPFEPIEGNQFEVGVKSEFFDGKASATLAAFQINRRNDLVRDPENPDFDIQIGERRSRGIEFDLTGEVLPGFNLIATYAFNDAEITEDPDLQGFQFDNIPRHSGSIWAVYEVQKGDFQGFGFGTGVFAVGERPGDLENTYELPAYGRVDTVLYYQRDNWKAQLNIENLFDTEYFARGRFRDSVLPGAPFTVRGQLSVEF